MTPRYLRGCFGGVTGDGGKRRTELGTAVEGENLMARNFVVRTLWLVAACIVLIPALANAQSVFTGTVKDTSGAVMPGVTVEAASPVLIEKVKSAITNENGQ